MDALEPRGDFSRVRRPGSDVQVIGFLPTWSRGEDADKEGIST